MHSLFVNRTCVASHIQNASICHIEHDHVIWRGGLLSMGHGYIAVRADGDSCKLACFVNVIGPTDGENSSFIKLSDYWFL